MNKKINAGDTLTVGDLTDDYLGAVIEVGTLVDITYTFTLGSLGDDWYSQKTLWTPKVRVGGFYPNTQVKVITPPPAVVQPDEPKIFGQHVRIKGMPDWLGIVVDTQDGNWTIMDSSGDWWYWDLVLLCAGERQIIVSDPPRWPDETPVVPERIERSDWPADDTHLRDYKWIDRDGGLWRWDDRDNRKSGWNWNPYLLPLISPLFGPWTRGERVK